MVMSDPISLRNIPPDTLQLAHALSRQTGLSINAVFRLALASGVLVELTKVAPGMDGTYVGLDAIRLAKALRRHLASAIDLLIEQGEHPYQDALNSRNNRAFHMPPDSEQPSPQTKASGVGAFDSSLGDDLEALGIGQGISETVS